ncbi:hypothetical protein [Lapillicoccus sp.]|uniref:hypothetical protein n=1 Tax=Lapillicoccus sp. TaxID=1909287 RepID=UPI0025ED4DA0|nr:hypothetical protein [Lapillicoccus sp.]
MTTVSKVTPLEEGIVDVIQRLLDEKGATATGVAEWTGMGVLSAEPPRPTRRLARQ